MKYYFSVSIKRKLLLLEKKVFRGFFKRLSYLLCETARMLFQIDIYNEKQFEESHKFHSKNEFMNF